MTVLTDKIAVVTGAGSGIESNYHSCMKRV